MINEEDKIDLSKNDMLKLLTNINKETLKISGQLLLENMVMSIMLIISTCVNIYFIIDWAKRSIE